MNIFSQLLFTFSIVYLAMGIVILYKDSKAALNRTFFALILTLFIWSFSTSVSITSPDKASCILWNTIASIGMCTFSSIAFHFFLIFSKRTAILKKWWVYIVIYFPAVILIVQAIKQNLYFSDVMHNQYGWRTIANTGSVWYWILLIIIGILGTLDIYICYAMLKNVVSKREKKQAKIIFISGATSFLITMGYNLFTNVFIKSGIPDMVSAGMMIWQLGILYAIVKYKLMTLSISLAAESILETIIDSIILVNPKGLITYINPETASLLNYKETDLLEKPIEMLFPKDKESEMKNTIKALDHGFVRNIDTIFLSQNGTRIPILFSAAVCNDDSGDYLGFVALSRDITEYKLREEEIRYLSYHDQLTGLYNRRFYEEELKRLDTSRNYPMSIIMGDVNGLKIINDSIGHAKGDELLNKVAQAIKKGCRADDVIARIGGDEFVVLLCKTNAVETERIINRINTLLSKEKVSDLDISVSFGYDVKNCEQEKIQEIFRTAEDRMYQYKQLNSESMRRNTIDLIMNALYEKNHREMLHSKRVGALCEEIALKMNFDKETVYNVKIAGLMHDIGKIGIDDKTLNKPGKLNADEWIEMKKHPETGKRILSSANEFAEISDYIFEHQEKWDGTGYPRGLKGEEILLQARIIAVADSYDAMTSHRSYGKTLSEEEAINEIKRCSGTQFDPAIAKTFVEKVLGKAWD